MRDDFKKETKETLAKRVNYLCSNPECRRLTSGPHTNPDKSTNIGVAAHITSASPGFGAYRYDETLSSEERKDIKNGIWLCQNCHKIIDSDEEKFPAQLLFQWKEIAENFAKHGIDDPISLFKSNVITSEELGFYSSNLIQFHKNWHIPSELKDLIDEKIPSVPIDSFLRFKLWTGSSFIDFSVAEENIESSIGELIEQQNRLFLLGSAGAAKSTLLKYLCYWYANQFLSQKTNLIPILITLRHYGENDLQGLFSIQLKYHGLSYSDSSIPSEALKTRNWVFLLDGFDEIPKGYREQFINDLNLLQKSSKDSFFILTARKQPEVFGLDNFKSYEIQPLNKKGIQSFANTYLSQQSESFLQQVEERNIWDLLHIPLLLTLCLISYKNEKDLLNSLTSIYSTIVELYKQRWEQPKKGRRSQNPINWQLLESSLSILAFKMIENGSVYELTRQETEKILIGFVQNLDKQFRWSRQNTIEDLIEQLSIHNFLEIFQDRISFWHSSFRDYFAAKYLIDESSEIKWGYIESKRIPLFSSFVLGFSPQDNAIRKKLVHYALFENDAYWANDALRVLDSNTIYDLILEAAKNTDLEILGALTNMLEGRRFLGHRVLNELLQTEVIIYDINEGYYETKDYIDWFPNPDSINYVYYYQLRKIILESLGYRKLKTANDTIDELKTYLENLRILNISLDNWLLSRQVQSVDDFRSLLKKNRFPASELKDFCRNTLLKSSLVFLEEIMNATTCNDLRIDAFLAIQCIKHPLR